MELVPIETWLDELEVSHGKSGAVDVLAGRLNTTRATIYRWVKSGDHFLVDEDEVESVFKLVKCIDK